MRSCDNGGRSTPGRDGEAPHWPDLDLESQPLMASEVDVDEDDELGAQQREQRRSESKSAVGKTSLFLRGLRAVRVVSLRLAILLGILCLVAWGVPRALDPHRPSAEERRRDAAWVSGSPYWADRQACRWLSLCGVHHLRWDPPAGHESRRPDFDVETAAPPRRSTKPGREGGSRRAGRADRTVPDYVLRHAPLVHLHPDEKFWPASAEEHVRHMRPLVGGRALGENSTTLARLGRLHAGGDGDEVCLTSTQDVETRPDWLHSRVGIPGPPAAGAGGVGRRSAAPATLVLVDKGGGVLDAFWFFFYSYNLGQTVLGVRFGNHVGDWEHCMVRFERGEPRAMFLSEHEGGQAYRWQALETTGGGGGGGSIGENARRPVIYSAVGSHAMYATAGDHPYVLPFRMLKDVTGKGPLWDPAQHYWAYWWEPGGEAEPEEIEIEDEAEEATGEAGVFEPATGGVPEAPPPGWLRFGGYWGDDLYGLGDKRQWRLFGQYHYVTGPTGPRDKKLWRDTMCPQARCRILDSLEEGRKRTWYNQNK